MVNEQFEPVDMQDFQSRFQDSIEHPGCDVASGLGMPCPFCAAPGFTKVPVFNSCDACQDTHTCHECGRAARFLFERGDINGIPTIHYQVLQTAGQPIPDWFVPRLGWVQ